ncbi:MAG: ABC transporter substrate-binding protein [Oscillospiraceae bacterium]
MKKVFTLMLSLMLTLALAGCSIEGPPPLKKVTVSEVARSVFYAPQYVAINQGFFEEEGLSIELLTGQGADKVMTAVVAGQADIGFSGPEAAIYVANEGRNNYAVVFAQVTKRDGSFIVGHEKAEPFQWEMLRGKHILGGRQGGVPEMTLEYVLRKNGLEPGRDINVDTSVQFALMAGAFTGGTADYTTLFEPTASMVEMEGKGYVLCSVGEVSGEMPYTCYYATREYMSSNPETIQKFTNALYKGQRWVQQHTAREIAQSISVFFPDTDIDLLEKVTQRHKDIDAFMTNPILRKDSFDRLQTVMEQAGQLKQRADYAKLVDTSFAQKAVDTIR